MTSQLTIIEVSITADTSKGLGLRLGSKVINDEGSPYTNVVIVEAFKRHPVSNQILPAEASGLFVPGDELLRINGEILYNRPMNEALLTFRNVVTRAKLDPLVISLRRNIITTPPPPEIKSKLLAATSLTSMVAIEEEKNMVNALLCDVELPVEKLIVCKRNNLIEEVSNRFNEKKAGIVEYLLNKEQIPCVSRYHNNFINEIGSIFHYGKSNIESRVGTSYSWVGKEIISTNAFDVPHIHNQPLWHPMYLCNMLFNSDTDVSAQDCVLQISNKLLLLSDAIELANRKQLYPVSQYLSMEHELTIEDMNRITVLGEYLYNIIEFHVVLSPSMKLSYLQSHGEDRLLMPCGDKLNMDDVVLLYAHCKLVLYYKTLLCNLENNADISDSTVEFDHWMERSRNCTVFMEVILQVKRLAGKGSKNTSRCIMPSAAIACSMLSTKSAQQELFECLFEQADEVNSKYQPGSSEFKGLYFGELWWSRMSAGK